MSELLVTIDVNTRDNLENSQSDFLQELTDEEAEKIVGGSSTRNYKSIVSKLRLTIKDYNTDFGSHIIDPGDGGCSLEP